MQAQEVFRLLDLPRELRERVYEFVLIPDVPIELAPITKCSQECDCTDLHPSESVHQEGPAEWHYRRYQQEIRTSLSLLRVNKQVNEEATKFYYGQDFRFSNPAGWWVLQHWLDSIGEQNRSFVRHITICHPALEDKGLWLTNFDHFLYRILLGGLGLKSQSYPFTPLISTGKESRLTPSSCRCQCLISAAFASSFSTL